MMNSLGLESDKSDINNLLMTEVTDSNKLAEIDAGEVEKTSKLNTIVLRYDDQTESHISLELASEESEKLMDRVSEKVNKDVCEGFRKTNVKEAGDDNDDESRTEVEKSVNSDYYSVRVENREAKVGEKLPMGWEKHEVI